MPIYSIDFVYSDSLMNLVVSVVRLVANDVVSAETNLLDLLVSYLGLIGNGSVVDFVELNWELV